LGEDRHAYRLDFFYRGVYQPQDNINIMNHQVQDYADVKGAVGKRA
jgi:hypothetical protein